MTAAHPIGFFSLFVGSILGVAGITGSSIHSVVQGNPDKARSGSSSVEGGGGSNTQNLGAGKPWRSELHRITSQNSWNEADWLWIVENESGGNPESVNKESGAFGLGQFLPSNRAEYPEAFSHNPNGQIRAMARYIKIRYGNPTAARKFHEANGWY